MRSDERMSITLEPVDEPWKGIKGKLFLHHGAGSGVVSAEELFGCVYPTTSQVLDRIAERIRDDREYEH